MTKILLTTTSFQDTPGEHHKLLADTGWEIIRARGPLNEADTLALVGDIDGYICGDDLITRKVLEKAVPKLKVISKYGIGSHSGRLIAWEFVRRNPDYEEDLITFRDVIARWHAEVIPNFPLAAISNGSH